METLALKLAQIRKAKGLSQEELSEAFGIKRTRLSSYEQGRAEPSLDVLAKYCQFFKIGMAELTGINAEDSQTGGLRIITLTENDEGDGNIELVSIKAAAGYAGGYGDVEYIQSLPKFRLPFLSRGNFRAFEIQGDSMLPIPSGSVVIGEHVESLRDIRLNDTYIVITLNDGVLFKRITRLDQSKQQILLKSDNPLYTTYSLPLSEIQEVWKTKLYMSYQFPEPNETLDRIEQSIKTLQEDVKSIPRAKA